MGLIPRKSVGASPSRKGMERNSPHKPSCTLRGLWVSDLQDRISTFIGKSSIAKDDQKNCCHTTSPELRSSSSGGDTAQQHAQGKTGLRVWGERITWCIGDHRRCEPSSASGLWWMMLPTRKANSEDNKRKTGTERCFFPPPCQCTTRNSWSV